MKRKVLLIHNGFPVGEEVGDKVRVLNMVQSLRNIGLDVVFLAFYKKGFSLLRKERSQSPKDVKCHYIYTLPDRFGLGGIAALCRALITWWFVKRYKIELIQLETTLSASCVRFVSRRIPVVTDFHADPVPELRMNGRSETYIKETIKDIKYALGRSRTVVAVSENLLSNLKGYFPYKGNTSILPCSFNEDVFQSVDKKAVNALRKKLGLEERIVLCYLGGTHRWQCIEETLDVFLRLRKLDPRNFLCVYTNGDMSPYSDKLREIEGDYLCKSLSYSEVPLYLSIVDAGFVLRQDSLVNINASPTKTSEYLASGAMVIATRYSGDAPAQIRDCGCGYLLQDVHPSDDELQGLHHQLQSYVRDRETNASKARSYAFAERIWLSNEKKLSGIYQGME